MLKFEVGEFNEKSEDAMLVNVSDSGVQGKEVLKFYIEKNGEMVEIDEVRVDHLNGVKLIYDLDGESNWLQVNENNRGSLKEIKTFNW